MPAMLFLLGGLLILAGAPGQAVAQVTSFYINDGVGYVRCDNINSQPYDPTVLTYHVSITNTVPTTAIQLDLTYDSNLTYLGTFSGDATTCTESAGVVTCYFPSPSVTSPYTVDVDFELDTPCAYSGLLLSDPVTVSWTAPLPGGSLTDTYGEKSWAGDNCMDDLIGATLNCVANDVTIRQLYVDRADVVDGCVSATDDWVTGEIMAGMVTGAQSRHDIAVFISLDGRDPATYVDPISGLSHTGECASDILWDDTQGQLPQCDTTTPYAPDLDGDGPYRNLELCPQMPATDLCGDIWQADAETWRTFGQRTMDCTDHDGDGFADVGYCVAWDQNQNDVACFALEDSLPGSPAKCYCGITNFGGVTAPDLSCTLTCPWSQVYPGQTITGCSVTFTNATSAGTAEWVRFKLEDEYSEIPASAGTFSSYSSDRSGDILDPATSGNPITWTPDVPTEADIGEFAPGDRTVVFDYTVDPTAGTTGTITVSANTYWYNDNTTWSPESLQPLSCSTTWNLAPTWALVSSFEAYEDAGGVVVKWETATEAKSAGFHIFRREPGGEWARVNEQLLPALQSTPGGVYRWIDEDAPRGDALEYKLVEVDYAGFESRHGPFLVNVVRPATAKDPLMASRYRTEPHEASAATVRRLAAAREVAAARGPASKTSMSGDRAKITVEDAGIYRIGAADIATALEAAEGPVTEAIRTGRVAISSGGEDVAWSASTDGGGLVFFGEGVDTVFTNKNVYWLTLQQGVQMETVKGRSPAPRTDVVSFAKSVHFEEDLEPRTYVTSNPLDDYWFWSWVISGSATGGSRTTPFEVHGVAPGAHTGTLVLNVSGYGPSATARAAEVYLNGTSLGEVSWYGEGSADLNLDFPQELLAEGSNTVEVVGTSGFFFFDGFDVTYARLYRAEADSLKVPGSAGTVTISGFSAPQISVYEIADPRGPRLLTGTTVDTAADGSFRVSFEADSVDGPYLALASSASLRPLSVRGDAPSRLKDHDSSADYLVITADGLLESAQGLARYRAHRGLRSMVVDLEDIMDEFNAGVFNPAAVRDFLAFATASWQPAPRYVALVGAGSFDYKDNLGAGGSIVPAIMVGTADGLVAADDAFADLIGDDLVPEMAIGRIPVLTAAELDAYVAKIVAYEEDSGAGWANRVLMVADNPDYAGDFIACSDGLARLVPLQLDTEKIYLGAPLTVDEARERILQELGDGSLLMSYIGHGGLDRLANEGLLVSSDVTSLANQERLPVVAALTCYVNFFAFPGFSSLGEELVVRADGGAGAVWGSTGLSRNDESYRLGQAFFRALFAADEGATLGDTVKESLERFANIGGGHRDTQALYNLLGDPALIVKDWTQ